MSYSADELRRLAEVFCAAQGIAPRTLGGRVGNSKVFTRLAAGKGCNSATAERLSRWFDEHWPPAIAWPLDQKEGRDAPRAGLARGKRRT